MVRLTGVALSVPSALPLILNPTVYTITNKKLKDPTARRLENFWWHVWGSDRRQLSGAALARLYEDISLGPAFVPLRGPSNRWEGPDVCQLVTPALAFHA
jgi:hypothetical protein